MSASVKWLRLKVGVPSPGSSTGSVINFFTSDLHDIQMNDDIFTIQSRHSAGHTCLPLDAAASFEFELAQSLVDRGFELSVAHAPSSPKVVDLPMPARKAKR